MYKVYLISTNLDDSICYKIGWTKRNPHQRLKELQTSNSSEVQLISSFETKWGPKIESSLHKRFSHLRKKGEWFELPINEVINFQKTCETIHNGFEVLSENTWAQESKDFSKYIKNIYK